LKAVTSETWNKFPEYISSGRITELSKDAECVVNVDELTSAVPQPLDRLRQIGISETLHNSLVVRILPSGFMRKGKENSLYHLASTVEIGATFLPNVDMVIKTRSNRSKCFCIRLIYIYTLLSIQPHYNTLILFADAKNSLLNCFPGLYSLSKAGGKEEFIPILCII